MGVRLSSDDSVRLGHVAQRLAATMLMSRICLVFVWGLSGPGKYTRDLGMPVGVVMRAGSSSGSAEPGHDTKVSRICLEFV